MARRIPKPFTVEIRRRSRKPAAAVQLLDPVQVAAPDEQPPIVWPGLDTVAEAIGKPDEKAAPALSITGRILPALEEPGIVDVAPKMLRQPRKRARLPTPTMADQPPEEVTPVLMETAAEDPAEAAMVPEDTLRRQGMKRLSRDHFRRGERWKARLPAAAHRRQR